MMETIKEQIKNKEAIRYLYEVILNQRKLELLHDLISDDYTNSQGGKGLEGFKKGITDIIKAFPDAKWTVDELICEGDRVVIKQTVQGTHQDSFQNIAATGNKISSQGFAMYTLRRGKIIYHQILTDRLGFLQQLAVLPSDLSVLTQRSNDYVFFVDRFIVPKNAFDEFTKRVAYNRNFIKTLPGFIKDEVLIQEEASGDINILTIAVWQNQDYLDKAKKMVAEEYKRINFNPSEFTQLMDIKMERQVYNVYQE